MRRVEGDRFGGADAYRLVERPEPALGPATVLVAVQAVGLGYADMLAATGGHQRKAALPFTPGSEFSGTIEAVGADVRSLAVGDRVTGVAASGALAERIVAPATAVRRIPGTLGFDEAAGLRVDYLTALHALADRGGLHAGERLLVLGAAGGVGRAAVQIGKALGAHVIAGASTAAKRAFARAQGADLTVDYRLPEWRDSLEGPVDVVFDPVGGALFEPAFRSLAWRGRYLVVGFAAGTISRLPLNLALVKGAALIGVEVGRFSMEEPTATARANDRIDALIVQEKIRPVVGRIFSIEAFAAAMHAVTDGNVPGKIVVRVAPASPSPSPPP